MDENTASKPLKPLMRLKNPVSLLSLYLYFTAPDNSPTPGDIKDFMYKLPNLRCDRTQFR
ncbi:MULTISPECIES: hypothetical protein [unclassified Microcoleus]|uniref:hypothetical protein n=1 Tax=unclassified Microcoleus TaxID=2642155 RepID=UPI002FCEC37F